VSASAIETALPDIVRLFPLTGAVLLPNALLPLNIFEPRYLAMVREAMSGDRMIGLVQPKTGAGERETVDPSDKPDLYPVGGLGRIIEFAETPDNRFLIVLQGVVRFRITAEIEGDAPFRQARVDYDAFVADVRDPPALPDGIRDQLEDSLRGYLDAQGLSADWDAVRQADDDGLVRTLAAVCPFDPIEKQALLESPTLPDRARMLVALMRFAPASAEAPSGRLQ
jgi:Lon protease-like protein